MRTELPRPFSTGFVLDKMELESIHDLLVRQVEGTRTPPNQYIATYEVRFRYGAIQERASLHDILNEPNGGELTIIGLKISIEDKNNPRDRTIVVQFSDARNQPNASIYYNISGTDAAWVNDTDAKLATKIRGITIFSPDSIFRQFIPEGKAGFVLALILLFTVIPLLTQPFLLIIAALFNVSLLESPVGQLIAYSGGFIVLPIGFYIIIQTISYFFPSYNFCWGAYAAIFKRRRAIGWWVFSAVIVAIIIGVLVNFITVKIGIH